MTVTSKPQSRTLDDERVLPGVTDAATYLSHLARYEFALRWMQPQHEVLETACGTGYGTGMLAGRAKSVVGIDYSPLAVEHARARYTADNLEFLVMDCHRLAFRNARFDVVVSFEVFEHLEGSDAYLRECRRVLRPGGLLLLSTPNRTTWDVHMRSIGQDYEFHINLVDLEGLRRALKPWFPSVQIYGQRRSGNWLYSALRAADVLNLRLRLFPPRQQERLQQRLGVVSGHAANGQHWIFSRNQLRQCNHFFAVCKKSD